MGQVSRGLFWYWLPVLVYAGTIFLFSAMSHPPVPTVGWQHFDKVLHFTEYAGFGAILYRALTKGGRQAASRKALFLSVILAALYGASDEFHQHFVPGRTMDIFDWLVDVLGASCGAWVCGMIYRSLEKRSQRNYPERTWR